MRAFLALWVLGCSSATPPPVSATPAPVAAATDYSDPDGDRILGACDACPEVKERWNDWANDDGCPETDEEILQVTTDPTNQYSGPLFQVQFTNDEASAPLDRTWQLDDGIEAVACAANAPDLALARQRATRLCKSVRSSAGKIQIVELSASKPQLYGRDSGKPREPTHGTGVIQVMRAKGIEIYRWQDDQLVRATPSRVVESRPLPDGCTWASFQEDRASGTWKYCDKCDSGSLVEGYRARWTGTPVYPMP